jgi:hypothetical protein
VRFQARYSGETESGRGKNNNSEPKPSIIFKAKDSYLGESNLPECNSAIYATWEREIYLLKKIIHLFTCAYIVWVICPYSPFNRKPGHKY